MKRKMFWFIMLAAFFTACAKLVPSPVSPAETLDGPVDGLTAEQKNAFLLGETAFQKDVFTNATGLGPYFVSNSCAGCHAGDGKGHPSTALIRFGQSDTNGNTFMGHGGPQLQNRCINGYEPEQLPPGAPFTRLVAPANTGLGFLEALSDEQILANADPYDANNDGISGRINLISPPSYFRPKAHHVIIRNKYIGRFGKKAAAIDLMHQSVNAYREDMGITSEYSPDEPSIYGSSSKASSESDVKPSTVANVVSYLRFLKVPARRNTGDAEVMRGEKLFTNIGCNACHIESWTTPANDMEALSVKTFSPYTDLLLHDMGAALDDGYTEGIALTNEWRTPPLWGLGLAATSQGGQVYLLHDGRAHSIEQAIEFHGGEGESSKARYMQLTEADKRSLIAFLNSL